MLTVSYIVRVLAKPKRSRVGEGGGVFTVTEGSRDRHLPRQFSVLASASM